MDKEAKRSSSTRIKVIGIQLYKSILMFMPNTNKGILKAFKMKAP